eukprot:765785-Hanusia_phi.AAC.1
MEARPSSHPCQRGRPRHCALHLMHLMKTFPPEMDDLSASQEVSGDPLFKRIRSRHFRRLKASFAYSQRHHCGYGS